MKIVLDFLTQLRDNNNRPWFEENKAFYKEALQEFNSFAEELIREIEQIDPSVYGLTLKDCTYRIYRDVRFSRNKQPYKTHMGVYVAPRGKNAGYAGYYFHVEPVGGEMLGGHFMTSGLYLPESKVLKIIREDIENSGDDFLETVKKAKGFYLEDGAEHKLKRVPAGFSADSKYAEYLKLKDFYLTRELNDKNLLQPDLVKNVVNEYKKTVDFVNWLNRAVSYFYEEEGGN